MASISEIIIVLSYMVFLSFSPGPNNILCSVNSTKYGIKNTLPLLAGVISGFFLVGLTTSLTVEFIKDQQGILNNMKYICGLYLIYLSYIIATDNPENYKESVDNLESPLKFKDGFLLQLINGKIIFYYIILMTTYASRFGADYSIKFGLLLAATFVGMSATSSWMFLGSLLRKFLSDSKKARITNYILGTLLAIVAIDLVFHEEIMEYM
ncbi:MAG: LysE family translocator [Candidatus Thermoplasmatota archaeon]|nr:LysE family translocator [Candidatus Thermoplasmatota archaeon]